MTNRTQRLSIVNQQAPNSKKTNEDACLAIGNGEQLYLLVADGASQRLETSKLVKLSRSHGDRSTPASYAAQLTRDTIASQISTYFGISPVELLLAANDALGNEIKSVYGDLTAESILAHESNLPELSEDSRLVRLALPACVATIAYIDYSTNTLTFAHAGDTALLVFLADGNVQIVTDDHMEQHDRRALSRAKDVQRSMGASHFADVLGHSDVTRLNRLNGIYHNFVDERGRPDKELGVGVIDGLPELKNYIQSSSLDLAMISSVLLCSDGFMWPTKWDELKANSADRLQVMRQHIEQRGISYYLELLRAEEERDSLRDSYPRFKIHDDATALYLEITHE